MHRTTRAVLALVTLSLGMSYLAERQTQATPRLMKKEGLTACGYCHVKPGGGGARNYRGTFYEMHGKSFAGFDDAAEAKAAGVPVGPDAEEKPLSMTPPAAPAAPAATPTPAPVAPKATPAPAAAKSASAVAADKAHTAMAAYNKTPKDAKAKAAYVTALNNLSHAYLAEKKNADAATIAKRALGLDPKNATAKANLAAATKK